MQYLALEKGFLKIVLSIMFSRSALTSGLTLSLARCVESFQHELNHILPHILGGMSETNLNGRETILTILGPNRDDPSPPVATCRVLQELCIRIVASVKTRQQWLPGRQQGSGLQNKTLVRTVVCLLLFQLVCIKILHPDK